MDLANLTAGGQSAWDMGIVREYNELLMLIGKEFMNADGLPARTWHKNILWNTAMEDGPSNVYPHIWYMLQYACEEAMLSEAFNVTRAVINGATDFLQVYFTVTDIPM